MSEADEGLKNIVARGGLTILYDALADHKEFWANWIHMRTGPMADFFAPMPEEQEAAKALGDALKKVADGLRMLKDIGEDDSN